MSRFLAVEILQSDEYPDKKCIAPRSKEVKGKVHILLVTLLPNSGEYTWIYPSINYHSASIMNEQIFEAYNSEILFKEDLPDNCKEKKVLINQ